jgi:hypothetical protein
VALTVVLDAVWFAGREREDWRILETKGGGMGEEAVEAGDGAVLEAAVLVLLGVLLFTLN